MSINIGQFLDKFRQTLGAEDNFKESIISVIKEKTGFQIEKKDITYQGGNIKIKSDPYLKTEINLHKESILNQIREKNPNKNILDIF